MLVGAAGIATAVAQTAPAIQALGTLALPDVVKHWSLTTLRDRLVEIAAKIVRHVRSIAFRMAEVMLPHALFQQILDAISALRPEAPRRW